MKKVFSFTNLCLFLFLNLGVFGVVKATTQPATETDTAPATGDVTNFTGMNPVFDQYNTSPVSPNASDVNAAARANSPGSNNYILLEPSVSQLPGDLLKGSSGKVAIGNNIGDVTSFIFVLLVSASLVAAVFMIMAGGFKRMTTDSIYKHTEGNEMIQRAVYGLLAVLSMYLIILVINPDMLQKGLNLASYRIAGMTGTAPAPIDTIAGATTVTSGSGGNVGCDSTESVQSAMTSTGGLCSSKSCSRKCNFSNDLLSLIKTESSTYGVNYKYIAALICRESSGDATAVGHHSNNNKPDCGLMQINSVSCDANIMNPKTNIDAGITLFKSKLNSVSVNYPNISKETASFASYNCCSGGEDPNSLSNDCTTDKGFSFTLPKWGCPINPGSGNFNMCAVKDYACDVTACANSY